MNVLESPETQAEQQYKCAKCGCRASLVDGNVQRDCGHNDEGVIAECSAQVTGTAAFGFSSPEE